MQGLGQFTRQRFRPIMVERRKMERDHILHACGTRECPSLVRGQVVFCCSSFCILLQERSFDEEQIGRLRQRNDARNIPPSFRRETRIGVLSGCRARTARFRSCSQGPGERPSS